MNSVINSTSRVLIVDDEVDICYFLSRNLSKRNFTTSYAHTLADAEKILLREIPSIVLLDNYLPDGDGVNFVSRIKSLYPRAKIIMITAHDTPQDRARAYGKGVDFFLAKPFAVTDINRVIDLLLEGKR